MMTPASRFKRFVAYFIDHLILSISIVVLACIVLVPLVGIGFVELSDGLILTYPAAGVIAILYFSLFESSKYQATPGKKLLNLYVSDTKNQKLSFKRALGRFFLWWLAPVISLLIPLILVGHTDSNWWIYLVHCIILAAWYIPIFFTKARTTVYDMLSSSRVNTRATSEENS